MDHTVLPADCSYRVIQVNCNGNGFIPLTDRI